MGQLPSASVGLSGPAVQAIYLHFNSKADLLVATFQYADEQAGTLELLRPIFEAATALEALDAGVTAYAAIEPHIYDIASAGYAVRCPNEAAEAAWQDRMSFRRGNVRRITERLQEEGFLAEGWTVDEAADFTWALLSVHIYEYLVVERDWPTERFVHHLRTVLRRTIVKEQNAVTK